MQLAADVARCLGLTRRAQPHPRHLVQTASPRPSRCNYNKTMFSGCSDSFQIAFR